MNSMKMLLIDGNSIMNRGYYALPRELTNHQGLHTNALLGFLNIFFRFYEEEQPTHIITAFDVHQPTFRHEMYPAYKGTRHGTDPELVEQFPVIREILHAMGISTVEKGGLEADDIIGTYSRRASDAGMSVVILSGDRDLLQLATDRILVRIPKTKGGKTTVEDYYAADVEKLYGVNPEAFIEMKGLMGDTSDNIPGVPGIGPKTASKIIQAYGTVENAILHADEIRPARAGENLKTYRDQAVLSRDLSRIRLDCDLPLNPEDAAVKETDIFSENALQVFRKYELKSLLKRFDGEFHGTGDENNKLQEIRPAEISSLGDIPEGHFTRVGFFPVLQKGKILGAAASPDTGRGEKNPVYFLRGFSDTDRAVLRKWLDDGITLCLQRVKYVIPELGLRETDPLFDCSLAAYLLDPLGGGYPYDTLSEKYLNLEFQSRETLLGKEKISEESFTDSGFLSWTAGNALSAALLGPVLEAELQKRKMWQLYKEIELPLSFVLREMEHTGLRCSADNLNAYGVTLNSRKTELEQKIFTAAGQTFNINSPKQLGKVLFEDLGLPGAKKTKTGYATGSDVLEKLKGEYPVVSDILEYRQVTKLISTYIAGLTECIGPDGRIHSTFHQTVTATGRISSADPNLQNIPARTEEGREIRKAFLPAPGCCFVDADYSQIELRVMASLSGDPDLIRAFREGEDIHAMTASQVFGVPLEKVDHNLRRKAKAVNFGIIYGISSFGLGQDLDISKKEAKEYIDKYFSTYKQVKVYLDRLVESAKDTGEAVTLFHRVRPVPELKSASFMTRSFGERVAMNAPIQGTAADIIKIAMIRVDRRLKAEHLKSRLVLQVHDELLVETDFAEKEEVKNILREEMEGAADLAVPLLVDIGEGMSMEEAKN